MSFVRPLSEEKHTRPPFSRKIRVSRTLGPQPKDGAILAPFAKLLFCAHAAEPPVTEKRLDLYINQVRHGLYAYSRVFGWEALIDLILEGEKGLPPKYQILINEALRRSKNKASF